MKQSRATLGNKGRGMGIKARDIENRTAAADWTHAIFCIHTDN
jgi:hypothetical protein